MPVKKNQPEQQEEAPQPQSPTVRRPYDNEVQDPFTPDDDTPYGLRDPWIDPNGEDVEDPQPPEPVAPEPVAPEPVTPEPVAPEPVAPEPVAPTPPQPVPNPNKPPKKVK